MENEKMIIDQVEEKAEQAASAALRMLKGAPEPGDKEIVGDLVQTTKACLEDVKARKAG